MIIRYSLPGDNENITIVLDNGEIQYTSIRNDRIQDFVRNGGIISPAEPLPLRYRDYFNIDPVRLVTTTGGQHELVRYTLPQNALYIAQLELEVVDLTNPAAGVAARHIEAVIFARRLINGVVLAPIVVEVDQYIPAAAETPGAIPIAAAIVGNDLIFRVTGAAGRTIHWFFSGKVKSVAPNGR